MFSCGEMIEWERKGERRVFSWGEENGGRRVFPQAHHLREKNFLPNLGRSQRGKWGESQFDVKLPIYPPLCLLILLLFVLFIFLGNVTGLLLLPLSFFLFFIFTIPRWWALFFFLSLSVFFSYQTHLFLLGFFARCFISCVSL